MLKLREIEEDPRFKTTDLMSLQDMMHKTEQQRKDIEAVMDRGHFDFDQANLLKGQPLKETFEILRTIKAVSLGRLHEFLASSGTAGLAGAAYLIPTKIYQIMFDSAVNADICDQISITMIPADQIPGTTMKVDVAKDDSYLPKKFSSGGSAPDQTIETVQATLDFSDIWSINFKIANDLIEDSQFDIIEMHLRNAGREMGEFATNEAITILMTSTDGDGTLNTEGAGSDVTTLTDVINGKEANLRDNYLSDIFLCSHHLIFDEVNKDTTFSQDATGWRDHLMTEGYPTRLLGMNVVYSECDMLTKALGVNNAFEDLNSYCLTKDYSLLTGRKRWLRIEKYSDPIKDLQGAAVTCRQDSVSVYNDSICRIRET